MLGDEEIENLFRWLKFEHYEKDGETIYTLSVNADVEGETYNFTVENIDAVRFFELIYDYVMGCTPEEILFLEFKKIGRK